MTIDKSDTKEVESSMPRQPMSGAFQEQMVQISGRELQAFREEVLLQTLLNYIGW